MAAIAQTVLTGSGGSVTIDSNILCVRSWRATVKAETVDVTSSCASGWREIAPSVKSVEATVTANVKNDGAGIPSIDVGATYAVILHGGPGVEITGNFLVGSFQWSLDVRGDFTVELSLMSTGAVTGVGI